MKTIKSFLVLVLFISLILSCDAVDELLSRDIDVPVSFVIDINNLSVPEDSSADNFFARTVDYDLLSNPDVADAIGTPEQIKKIIFNSVQYQYRNFSGNVDASVSGEIEFWASFNSTYYFNTQPVNVSVASFTTELFNLQGAQGVNLQIDDNGYVSASYRGSSTAKPILFDTRVFVNATVTVEVNLNDL